MTTIFLFQIKSLVVNWTLHHVVTWSTHSKTEREKKVRHLLQHNSHGCKKKKLSSVWYEKLLETIRFFFFFLFCVNYDILPTGSFIPCYLKGGKGGVYWRKKESGGYKGGEGVRRIKKSKSWFYFMYKVPNE